MMEYRVSKASAVSIITAFTPHQLSTDIFFSLLSMKDDNLKVPEIKSYILSRGLSVFGRFFRFVSRSDIPKFRK